MIEFWEFSIQKLPILLSVGDIVSEPAKIIKIRLKFRRKEDIKRYFGPFAFNTETGLSTVALPIMNRQIRIIKTQKLYLDTFEFLEEEVNVYPTVHVAGNEPIKIKEEDWLEAKEKELGASETETVWDTTQKVWETGEIWDIKQLPTETKIPKVKRKYKSKKQIEQNQDG